MADVEEFTAHLKDSRGAHSSNTPQTRLKPAARVVPRSCRPREKVQSIGSVPKMTRRSRPSSPASSRIRRQRQG